MQLQLILFQAFLPRRYAPDHTGHEGAVSSLAAFGDARESQLQRLYPKRSC